MNVYTTSAVKKYLNDLVAILYEREYFGFEDAAIKYVKELVYDIKTYLPTKQHSLAPKYFDKYGKNMYYASFRKNKQTTWYAFFNKYKKNEEIIYLIRYIANNHTVAQYLEVS
jgi:hypothetical protein